MTQISADHIDWSYASNGRIPLDAISATSYGSSRAVRDGTLYDLEAIISELVHAVEQHDDQLAGIPVDDPRIPKPPTVEIDYIALHSHEFGVNAGSRLASSYDLSMVLNRYLGGSGTEKRQTTAGRNYTLGEFLSTVGIVTEICAHQEKELNRLRNDLDGMHEMVKRLTTRIAEMDNAYVRDELAQILLDS